VADTMSSSVMYRVRAADPVSAHMREELLKLRAGMTVGEALAELRANPPRDRILYLYVVDEKDVLRGVIPTRSLILAAEGARVEEIMSGSVVSIPLSSTLLEACEQFLLHRFLAFPVVDREGRIVGIIDVETFTDELFNLAERESVDALFQFVGIRVAEARGRGSVRHAFVRRLPWLLCSLAGGMACAGIAGLYRVEIAQAVAIALFLPVVLALAESVGIQALSVALSSLRGPGVRLRDYVPRMAHELGTALMLGFSAGGLVALVARLGQESWDLSLSLVLAIGLGTMAASLLGAFLPAVLHALRRDPQIAAGPIVLALTDVTALAVYLSIAVFVMA